ncbi:Prefoldin subunit-domain-containing protein [Xylaria cf. heliscus]|nr:Prefoldin subunit-domain-containing protein [Xylaria cf. heliscus]
MSQIRDPSEDLEKRLEQLAKQVDNLVVALDEWRQWKQEYEALRTDVQALSPATRAALTETREAFKGELVDEKELIEIFGRNDTRKRDQIISTVSNRLDYVSKNIDTLAKQLEAAENKLAATRIVSFPEATDEDGLPITEISEELDDDDNVISYSLRRPGDSQTQLLEALEKAGIKELPSASHEPASVETSDRPKDKPDVSSDDPADTKQQLQSNGGHATEVAKTEQAPKKKSVAFTEDTKPANEQKPTSTVQRLEELYRQAKDQENLISDPIMPADESPEDAELREDMIRYNKETMMYEMAPIVAELQLEEGSADDDDWDYDDSEEEDDDEDQWGRSTSGVVDDEYRRQMLELKERLSKQTFGEQKTSDDDEDDEFAEGIGRITVRNGNIDSIQNDSKSPEINENLLDSALKDEVKKSVRFAPNLDIAEPSSSAAQAEPAQRQHPEIDPLSDVVERHSSGANKTTPKSGRKPSKFRKERANGGPAPQIPSIAPEKPTDTARYAPSGPEGQTLASSILEHEPSGAVKEPDELDANLLHQQVTEEYYKMRNSMIARQGGFLKENTDPIQPLEEEEGGPKRVSRFKAARLAKS